MTPLPIERRHPRLVATLQEAGWTQHDDQTWIRATDTLTTEADWDGFHLHHLSTRDPDAIQAVLAPLIALARNAHLPLFLPADLASLLPTPATAAPREGYCAWIPPAPATPRATAPTEPSSSWGLTILMGVMAVTMIVTLFHA
jgi:hypothetical protein